MDSGLAPSARPGMTTEATQRQRKTHLEQFNSPETECARAAVSMEPSTNAGLGAQ
jgi:hypothetical protein